MGLLAIAVAKKILCAVEMFNCLFVIFGMCWTGRVRASPFAHSRLTSC